MMYFYQRSVPPMVTLAWVVAAMALTGCGDPSLDDRAAQGFDTGSETSPALVAQASESARSEGFVTVAGTTFRLNGEPFYFQGTNFHQAIIDDWYSDEEIYDVMAKIARRGIRVVRMWAFSCQGQTSRNAMIKSISREGFEYGEAGWRKLDTAIDAARSAGLKLILPLVNYEPDYCGMNWWVEQITGSKDRARFLFDEDVRSLFKSHIHTFLTRVNTRYQEVLGRDIEYREDPTIMAIEMANEPHTVDAYEKDRGIVPGELTYNWLAEMTAHVRSIDSRHLITTGEEGYKTQYSTGPDARMHSWLNDGLKGVDFARNIRLPHVSFATVHIYPDNINIPTAHAWWIRQYLFQDRAAIAHAANKPIVLEETGFNPRPSQWQRGLGWVDNIPYWLRKVYAWANEAGFAGTMVWQTLPDEYAGGGMEFPFSSAEGGVIRAQIRCMESKIRGEDDCHDINGADDPSCTNTPPDATYTCAQQAGWGQCGERWMSGHCNETCGRCIPGRACEDVPPDDYYTCAQQAAWGKCGESWMRERCDQSCGRCSVDRSCSDLAPDRFYTCPQQAGWGKCDEPWMQGYCQQSCGRCDDGGP